MAERLVEVEWIGDPPILDDFTKARIAAGEVPQEAVAVLRAAEQRRNKVLKGYTKRIVDPDYFPGLSGQIVFGPDVFVKLISYSDADILLGSSSCHEFRLAGNDALRMELPANDIALVGEMEFNATELRQALR